MYPGHPGIEKRASHQQTFARNSGQLERKRGLRWKKGTRSAHIRMQLRKKAWPPPSYVHLINHKERYQKHPTAGPKRRNCAMVVILRLQKKHHISIPSRASPEKKHGHSSHISLINRKELYQKPPTAGPNRMNCTMAIL